MLALIHIQWIVGIIFIILYCVTILGLVLVIITENRNPLKTIPWVIVLLLAPGIGLLFYFFFGQDNRKQRIISRRTYKRIMKRPQEGKQITDFTDENGTDHMKQVVQENYERIKAEAGRIVAEELERIKNDPVLCKLLPEQN